MIWNMKRGCRAVALLSALLAIMPTFDIAYAQTASTSQPVTQAFEPIAVKHALGETMIERPPQRVVALDMNELDFLDQLGVPVAGTVKDFIPHFLSKYGTDPEIMNLGFLMKPNLERVYALHPDLILITSLQAKQYNELSRIAPVLHFDVDYRNSQSGHIEAIKNHFMMLGRIFGKENLAKQKVIEFDKKIEEVRRVALERPEKALVVLHNNGSFRSFGVQSRYGFVFSDFGVKPASAIAETGLHGQPITSEFIQTTNPDILFVIDRTAVMEHRSVLTAESIENPLLLQTNAWKNGRVFFVDAEAWYTTAASITPLKIMIDDIISAYRK